MAVRARAPKAVRWCSCVLLRSGRERRAAHSAPGVVHKRRILSCRDVLAAGASDLGGQAAIALSGKFRQSLSCRAFATKGHESR